MTRDDHTGEIAIQWAHEVGLVDVWVSPVMAHDSSYYVDVYARCDGHIRRVGEIRKHKRGAAPALVMHIQETTT